MNRFVDEIDIKVIAGNGGNGCVSFRREKFIPKGGPDGGDGGHGGSVFLEASPHVQTLLDLKYKSIYRSQSGNGGSGAQRSGASGEDIILPVPVGTLITSEDGEIEFDLVKPYQRVCVAKGGRGGLGNVHFKSSTHQTPREATPGQAGEERSLHLELKLVCDLGILGLPNAGKSSLLAAMTMAHPKVADYPFTTLAPQLGVIETDPPIVMADIPGLVEGAHVNRGLGHRFLRHVSRSKALIYLLSLSPDQTLEDNLEILRSELRFYNPELLDKHSLLVVNKSDLLASNPEYQEQWDNFKKEHPETILISALQQDGFVEFNEKLKALAHRDLATESCDASTDSLRMIG